MSEKEQLTTAGTSVFLDSNVILECRDLADLPWCEIDPVGPLRLLIVPRVAHEVDKRKRDGRLSRRARAFNQLLGQTLSTGVALIRDADPKVEIARAPISAIAWDQFGDLDRDDADHRIVAEILHAKGIDTARKIVVSHDINPLGIARDHGLRIHHVGDHWLLPPEPSPADKELQRLKSRIAVLEATQPEFAITIEVEGGTPATLRRFTPLPASQKGALLESLIEELEPPQNGRSGLGGAFDPFRDSSFERRWDDFVEDTLPAFVDDYARKMELLFNQRPLRILVRNMGSVQASDLTIEITASQGWINGAYVMVSPRGPSAPRPRNPLDYNAHNFLGRYQGGLNVGRHEFSWVAPPERTRRCVVACAAFSIDEEWTFEGSLFLDAHANAYAELSVKVRASNLRGLAERTIAIETQVTEGPPPTILEGNMDERDSPFILKAITAALQRDDTDLLEYDGEESD